MFTLIYIIAETAHLATSIAPISIHYPAPFYLYFVLQFFDQISYMKFGFIGLVLNEFKDKTFVCNPTAVPKQFCDGNLILGVNGYNRYNVGYCAGCMIVYIAVCRITSYIALRFLKM